MSSSPPKRASMNRAHSPSDPARTTNPVNCFMGTERNMTGNCGLSLPISAIEISTSSVAASTGAASSSAATNTPLAA